MVIMIDRRLPDNALMEEIGNRLKERRLAINITQAAIAKRMCVNRNTIVAIENGSDVKLSSLLAYLRELGLIENLDQLVPELEMSPFELDRIARMKQKNKRERASNKTPKPAGGDVW